MMGSATDHNSIFFVPELSKADGRRLEKSQEFAPTYWSYRKESCRNSLKFFFGLLLIFFEPSMKIGLFSYNLLAAENIVGLVLLPDTAAMSDTEDISLDFVQQRSREILGAFIEKSDRYHDSTLRDSPRKRKSTLRMLQVLREDLNALKFQISYLSDHCEALPFNFFVCEQLLRALVKLQNIENRIPTSDSGNTTTIMEEVESCLQILNLELHAPVMLQFLTGFDQNLSTSFPSEESLVYTQNNLLTLAELLRRQRSHTDLGNQLKATMSKLWVVIYTLSEIANTDQPTKKVYEPVIQTYLLDIKANLTLILELIKTG